MPMWFAVVSNIEPHSEGRHVVISWFIMHSVGRIPTAQQHSEGVFTPPLLWWVGDCCGNRNRVGGSELKAICLVNADAPSGRKHQLYRRKNRRLSSITRPNEAVQPTIRPPSKVFNAAKILDDKLSNVHSFTNVLLSLSVLCRGYISRKDWATA